MTYPRFFILLLFIVIFVAVRLVIQPINSLDYEINSRGAQLIWEGQDPYSVVGYFVPPWANFFIIWIAYQPLQTWLALSTALFVAAMFDLGKPSALLLTLHPAFFTLIASSNPEWLYIGSGLWLLYRQPRGWGRGIAWLLLACKPQTTLLLLAVEGIDGLRTRDWRAFAVALVGAAAGWLLFPGFWARFQDRLAIEWSMSVIFHYGVFGAVLATLAVLALRYNRLRDARTLGILLTPIWTPYILQYGYVATLFTLRSAGWLRNGIYVVAGIGLVALFWQEFHAVEHLATLGMTLLAALLSPAETAATPKTPAPISYETAANP